MNDEQKTMSLITQERLAVVMASGCEDELQLGAKLLRYVQDLCSSILSCDLSLAQRTGVERTKADTPFALGQLTKIINESRHTQEDKDNLIFITVKMMDNLLSVGALDTAVSEINFSRINGKAGGLKTGQHNKRRAEDWMNKARPILLSLRQQHPDAPQPKLADMLLASDKIKQSILPVHARIVLFIRQMIKEGEMAPRRKAVREAP